MKRTVLGIVWLKAFDDEGAAVKNLVTGWWGFLQVLAGGITGQDSVHGVASLMVPGASDL